MTLAKFAALILNAATTIQDILPIAQTVSALIHAAWRSPIVPKKADGSEYSPAELTALIVEMQDAAHAAWHQGDPVPPTTNG